jgi:hypothetical protein
MASAVAPGSAGVKTLGGEKKGREAASAGAGVRPEAKRSAAGDDDDDDDDEVEFMKGGQLSMDEEVSLIDAAHELVEDDEGDDEVVDDDDDVDPLETKWTETGGSKEERRGGKRRGEEGRKDERLEDFRKFDIQIHDRKNEIDHDIAVWKMLIYNVCGTKKPYIYYTGP